MSAHEHNWAPLRGAMSVGGSDDPSADQRAYSGKNPYAFRGDMRFLGGRVLLPRTLTLRDVEVMVENKLAEERQMWEGEKGEACAAAWEQGKDMGRHEGFQEAARALTHMSFLQRARTGVEILHRHLVGKSRVVTSKVDDDLRYIEKGIEAAEGEIRKLVEEWS